MRGHRFLGAAALLGALGGQAAMAGEHVRVVLDLSQSMRKNDPDRLAILATSLLYDLAAPNPTVDDSFEILPFDRDWRWAKPSDAPPVATRARIRVGLERRDALAAELAGLDYDARMTYFYPGLVAAVADLRATPGAERDTRTIVLLTDGVPEEPTREREAELIREELLPAFEEHRIRLYVLAFSAEALARRDFLEAMVRGRNGPLGQVFVDPDGSRLVASMLSLFEHSFGYTSTAAAVPGTTTLDLEGSSQPAKVAVVVHAPRPTPPELRLSPPAGGALSAPEGVVSARQKSASYSLQWVLSPSPGSYRLATDLGDGEVAVLRPAQLELEVLPSPPRTQTERTMAETPLALRVRVRSRVGGDPGPVDLSFRPVGERIDPAKGSEAYAWRGDQGGPAAGAGTPTPEGRLYEIAPIFEPNRRQPGAVYVGYLELKALRDMALVGSRLDHHAHRVEVHPHLALAPLPLEAYLADHALGRYGEGCTRFALTLAAGELPHPDKPQYALRVTLTPPDPAVFERELQLALFTLDGVPLGTGAAGSGESWRDGRRLEREALLGEHELCVRLGDPTAGDPNLPLELPLVFTLVEAPYDDFDVVTPFRAKLLVAPPAPLDRWRSLLVLGAIALAVAAELWHLRERPSLPGDLRYALARDPASLTARMPGASSPLRRLLALRAEHPLVAEGGETPAWLVPDGGELFRLRAAGGVRILADDGSVVPLERGRASLAVHRLYRLEGDGGTRFLRLEYDPGPDSEAKSAAR